MKKQKTLVAGVLVLLALSLSINTKAQKQMVWSIGPEAGVSFSKYGNDAASSEFKAGGVTGLFVTYSIINTFAITSKVLYYEKGAAFSSLNSNQTLQYIELPVMGRFFLNKEGKIRPNIFLGPTLAFLVGAKNKTGSNTEQLSNYKNSFNAVDYGLTGGAGISFRIRNETYLVLDGRYTHGIADISKGNDEVNTQSWALTAGLQFGIGKH